MKKPLDVRGKGEGVANPGLAPVKGAALKKRTSGKKKEMGWFEKQHYAMGGSKETLKKAASDYDRTINAAKSYD